MPTVLELTPEQLDARSSWPLETLLPYARAGLVFLDGVKVRLIERPTT
jgi:hypothetical protein